MQHYYSLDSIFLKGTWLTIGTFDGVHLGHKTILDGLIQEAHHNQALAVVITFHPRPAIVLQKGPGSRYLTDPEERAILLGQLGVDVVITYPFTLQVAGMSAVEFISELHAHLKMKSIWSGTDFAMGRNREGNLETLKKLGETFGYKVTALEKIQVGDEYISSSSIRILLDEGKIRDANRMLGRSYSIRGKVIPGDGRGKTIGIPTANLEIWSEKLIPKTGVYVCHSVISSRRYGSVINIGFRPTFNTQDKRAVVEAHILDLDEDLYGKEITLEFFDRLRDEQRFDSISTLVEQIRTDISLAREMLSSA